MRTDWLRLHYHAPKNAKVLALPSDAARWAWIVALSEGKQQTNPGQWVSEAHLRACLGRLAKHVPALLEAGLLDISAGGVVSVHDWTDWQSDQRYDPTAADRQRRHRENERLSRDSDVTVLRDGQRDRRYPTHPTHPPTDRVMNQMEVPVGGGGFEHVGRPLAEVGLALGLDGKWQGPDAAKDPPAEADP